LKTPAGKESIQIHHGNKDPQESAISNQQSRSTDRRKQCVVTNISFSLSG
jgi:hypothetical protein